MREEIKKHAPSAAVQPLVAQYWSGTISGKRTTALEQKVVPSGYVELVLYLPDTGQRVKTTNRRPTSSFFSLFGFWMAPEVLSLRQGAEMFGIRFKPEAMYTVFGESAAALLNGSTPLEKALGPSFTTFGALMAKLKTPEERVLLADAYFLKKLRLADTTPSYLEMAADLIRQQSRTTTVERLSSEVCIGIRQLEREFKNKLGFSPKTYMRITRLHAVLQLISQDPSLSLAQLSYLGGYADQAHFNRDFKQITGEIPSTYLAKRKEFLSF